MAAINGTSTGYLGTSGAPSIGSTAWASLQSAFGQEYFVSSATAAKVTFVSGTTVRVGTGVVGGRGVVDTFTGTRDVTLPTPGSDGTVHYLIVVRRTWQTAMASTIEYVTGTSTRAIPAGRNNNPGTIDDQPLALVSIVKNGATITVTVVDDLRAVGYGKGYYEVYSNLVITSAGYMDKPGYKFRIAGTEWVRLADGTLEKTAAPLEITSTFGTTPDGWNSGGTRFPSQMARDLKRRTMDLEVRRLAASAGGGTITPNANGQIGNQHVFTLTDGDRPLRQVPLYGTYLGTNGGDATALGHIEATTGKVYLATMAPNVPMEIAASGGWSLRLSGTWYTA